MGDVKDNEEHHDTGTKTRRITVEEMASSKFLCVMNNPSQPLMLPALLDHLFIKDADLGTLHCLRGALIVLEGPIGVGKSTLGPVLADRMCANSIKTVYLSEVYNNAMLGLYCSNIPKYAFPFQYVIVHQRIEAYKKAEKQARNGVSIIIDRGIAGDVAFALMQCHLGYFTDAEWSVYCDIVREAKRHKPTLVIKMECDPEVSVSRVANRDNKPEKVYDPNYMSNYEIALCAALKWLHGDDNSVATVVVNCNEDLTDSGNRVNWTPFKLDTLQADMERAAHATYGVRA